MLTEREAASCGPRDLKRPGTVEWAWQTLSALKRHWVQKKLSVSQFEDILVELEEYHAWDIVPPGNPYGTMDAMLRAEIGKGEEEAREDIGKRQQAARQAALDNGEPLQPHGTNQHSGEEITNSETVMSSPQGNAVSYRVRKLRRDCPEAAAKLERGEFKSVAAAERYARGEEPHPPRRVLTPLERAKRNFLKLSKAERRQLRRWVEAHRDD
jgi:hypothetical protein